jgi:hypothetical protein
MRVGCAGAIFLCAGAERCLFALGVRPLDLDRGFGLFALRLDNVQPLV